MKSHFLLSLLLLVSPSTFAASHHYDVVVYGGTAGGAIAAIAASGEGLSVGIVEPGKYIGGMVTGGLGRTDYGNQSVIGGMSRDFFVRVGKHYGEDLSWFFEPHVATKVLHEWLDSAKVSLHFGSPVEAVRKEGAKLVSFSLVNGDTFTADHFIDASYEGDLFAKAGVSYTWGREASSVYNETLAGVLAYSDKHQFKEAVNPYGEDGKLLPLVGAQPLDAPGTGDRKVQAYNFRLCMTKAPDNRVPFPKPEDYDPARWELLARYLDAQPGLTVEDLMNPIIVANGKTDTNNDGPISSDYIGGSWEYPEADYARRKEIWEEHRRYVQGFFYFLQNDPRVPKALHEEMQEWGLAKDEFTDNGHWPHQLYVREARRMVGAKVMTQRDLQEDRTKPDSIGMGSYNSDSHHVQRIAVATEGPWGDATPRALNEGDMQVPVQPYEMAYGAIVPKAGEADNLFVIGGFSASHVAYSSMRMEPQYMILGHAAGIAAKLARDSGVPVQSVDTQALQARLREQGAVLSMAEAHAPHFPVGKLAGIVVDNSDAVAVGQWRGSTTVVPFVGVNYLTEVEPSKGGNTVTFTAELPKPGRYELRLAWSPDSNRAPDAMVEINTGAETVRRTLDQRKKHAGKEPFTSLGTFDCTSSSPTVTLGSGSKGYAVADAVQWLPAAQE